MTMYELEDGFFTHENPNIHKLVTIFKGMLMTTEAHQNEVMAKADLLEAQKGNYEVSGLMEAYYDQMDGLEEAWNRLEKRRAFWDNCCYLATNAEEDFKEQLTRARAGNPELSGELDDVLKDSA